MAEQIEQQQIKEILRKEYTKCALNPEYFLKKYCIIEHRQKGKIPFILYDFQKKTLDVFIEKEYTIVLKARQLGISTLVAGYALHTMLFGESKLVLVIATKQDTAKNLVTKVKVMYDNLPSWLQEPVVERNKLSLKFANDSTIIAEASSDQAGRSHAATLLILDEAAFIPKIDTIWAAASQTMATGGKCIALSTPNGFGGWFHGKWLDSGDGMNDGEFFPVKLHWSVHPERDQRWRDQQDVILGRDLAAQECECSFLQSGRSVLDGLLIDKYSNQYEREPIEKRGIDNNLWIWEQPVYNGSITYLVSADVARGDGSDYSAFHVLNIETLEQVAEYRGQLGTTEFGNLCVNVSREYNNALLIIENNNIGWATIQQVINRKYENLFYTSKDLKYVDVEHQITNKINREERRMTPGFSTTSKTRPLIVAKLVEFFEDELVIPHSKRLFNELLTFIWNGDKAEAMAGKNDDLVISLAIGLWIRDTALRLKSQGIELQKKALDHILGNQGLYKSHDSDKPDEWEWDTGIGDKEDLTWLIG